MIKYLSNVEIAANLTVKGRVKSNLADGGLSPLDVTSRVRNINFNADLLDGYEATDFPRKVENAIISGNWTFTNAPEITNWGTNPNSAATYGQVTAFSYWTKTGSDLSYSLGKVDINYPWAKTDTTERRAFTVASSGASPFELGVSAIGDASLANRRFILQTAERGTAYGGILSLQRAGGQVMIGGDLTNSYLLNVNGSLNITGPIAISGSQGSANQYMKTSGSAISWATIAESDVTNLVSDLAAKQPLLSGTGLVKSTAGVISYITDNSANWNAAYTASHTILTLGTTNGLSLAGQVLSLQAATASVPGALLSADFVAFSGKQAALNGTGYVRMAGTTVNYDSRATINYWSLSGSDVYTMGNVGVGGVPTVPLHIFYPGAKTYTGTTQVIRFNSNDSNPNTLEMAAIGGASQGNRAFTFQTSETGVAYGGIIQFQGNGGVVQFGSGGVDMQGAFRFLGSAGSSGQYLKSAGGSTNTWGAVTSGDVTGALGYTPVPNSRNLVINGTVGRISSSAGFQDLTLDRAWTLDLVSGIVSPGTYQNVTVDTYGRVTGGTNPNTLAGFGIIDGAPLVHTHAFSSLTSIPTTLSGYGITNGVAFSSTGTAGYLTQWNSGGTGIENSRVRDTGSEINVNFPLGVEQDSAFRADLHVHQNLRIGKSGYHGTLIIHDAGSATIDASAAFEIRSTSKGLLAPRMTYAQRVAISSPGTGLLVYQTDATPGGGGAGYKYHIGSGIWLGLATVAP